MRFTRVSSGQVTFQAHASDDSRFVLLPVMSPSQIQGWKIYDSSAGQLLSDTLYPNLLDAKAVLNTLEKEGTLHAG